ncbi:MAG: hypothetical protein V4549_07675 [Bacteroidota bacterium]
MKKNAQPKLHVSFTKKIAKEIAEISFGYVLDCVLGYSDTGYDMDTSADNFEQNFEEDMQEKGIVVTDRKIKLTKECYTKMVEDFKIFVRKKYYDKTSIKN